MQLVAGEEHIGAVGGSTISASVELTRPANTTAYTAKDAVADVSGKELRFFNAGRVKGGSGYITKARLLTDQEANVSTFRLWVYTAPPVPALADNAPFGLMWVDNKKVVGYIDVGPLAAEDTTAGDSAQGLIADCRLAYVCDARYTDLVVVIETLAAFTPASGQKVFVELTFERN